MALKVFRAVWFLSALLVLADLLYVYASLPEVVAVQEAEGAQVLLDREILFYVMLVLIAICNVLVYLISRLGVPGVPGVRDTGSFLIYFTWVVAKLLVVRGLM